MNTYFRNLNAAAVLMATFGFASAEVAAGWAPIIDADPTDIASNPGHPSNQNPTTVGAYLQDLMNLAAAPTWLRRNAGSSGGMLSGLGNPAKSNTFLLAFHYGNGNAAWEHDAPFDKFFSCQSACDSFPLLDENGLGNYLLYSTGTETGALNPGSDIDLDGPEQVPEPGSIALLGIGLVGLGFGRRKH